MDFLDITLTELRRFASMLNKVMLEKELQKQSLGFDPLLSDSVTLCSQQAHQRPGV